MNFLRTFMAGRYGPDHLNTALIIFALLLSFLSRFAILSLLVYPSYLLLALTVFRFLSRNIQRRLRTTIRFIGWSSRAGRHKNGEKPTPFRCPSCSAFYAPRQRQAADYLPKCGDFQNIE